jgi:hypothetical protein
MDHGWKVKSEEVKRRASMEKRETGKGDSAVAVVVSFLVQLFS